MAGLAYNSMKYNISFNMETADPDDVMTLLYLCSSPNFNLVSVVITPGSNEQVGLVKYILNRLDINIPVGVRKPNYNKSCVSDFHYKWLGKINPQNPDGLGKDILNDSYINNPDLIILSGAGLGNVADFLDFQPNLNKMVIQGGFAGDSVVPEQYRMDKFKGIEICPTFNLNADIDAAKKVIAYSNINRKFFISKNVCHSVVYDNDMHSILEPYKNKNKAFNLMYQGMDFYLKKHKDGKKFHDPLAAASILDENICEYEEVEVFRESGKWGSRKKRLTNTFISISYNKDKFINALIGI